MALANCYNCSQSVSITSNGNSRYIECSSCDFKMLILQLKGDETPEQEAALIATVTEVWNAGPQS